VVWRIQVAFGPIDRDEHAPDETCFGVHDRRAEEVTFRRLSLLIGGQTSIGPADGEAAAQELLIGAGGGQLQGFLPGVGGGVLAQADAARRCRTAPLPGRRSD
jgi:hypothetical protein